MSTPFPYHKQEISDSFQDLMQQSFSLYNSISPEQLEHRIAQKWSSSDQVSHLIKSTKPVIMAMGLPKITLRMFGTNKDDSRKYEVVRNFYHSILKKGGQSTKAYYPENRNNLSSEEFKRKLLGQWDKMSENLIGRIADWNEKDLDKYRLPHPLLGKLTVREMLFFTHYHIGHHNNNIVELCGLNGLK